MNPAITLDDIENHPEIKWDYYALSNNPNITWEYVEENLDEDWDYHSLSANEMTKDKRYNYEKKTHTTHTTEYVLK